MTRDKYNRTFREILGETEYQRFIEKMRGGYRYNWGNKRKKFKDNNVPISHRDSVNSWREKNPLKIKAHRKVFVAVRNGTLKKSACFCGITKVEAHHEDYTKPLDIIWLCKAHHVKADKELRSRAMK